MQDLIRLRREPGSQQPGERRRADRRDQASQCRTRDPRDCAGSRLLRHATLHASGDPDEYSIALDV